MPLRRPNRAEIMMHKRRLLEHSRDFMEAQRVMHGDRHMNTMNARYDLAIKAMDHAEEMWKYLQEESRKGTTPEMRERIAEAEKEFEFFSKEKEELERKFRKRK